MKRILALGTVALAVAVGLTACSTKDTSQGSGQKEITFLTFETPNLPGFYVIAKGPAQIINSQILR